MKRFIPVLAIATFVVAFLPLLPMSGGTARGNTDSALEGITPPSSGTFLYLNSDAGDYIGQGQQILFTSDDATFTESQDGSLLSVSVLASGNERWRVYMEAPAGQPLVPGTYEGAARWPFQDAEQPGLSVSGDGRGCNRLSGRFVVDEAVWGEDNAVATFHATFEQHCEGREPALFGEIRIENPGTPPVTPTAKPTSPAPAPVPSPYLEVDMMKDGDQWCNPVDPEAQHAQGEAFQVAICLTNAERPPAAFNISLLYDDTLNACFPPTDCTVGTCWDTNPDANLGSTHWTTPDLGPNWGCGFSGGPACDDDTATGTGHGKIFLECMCVAPGCATLPVGPGISSPLAVVSFAAGAEGVDNLTFGVSALYDWEGELVGRCGYPFTCPGGSERNLGPPTPTPRPGVGGAVQLPPPAITAQADDPGQGSGWSAGVYAALGGMVVVVAVGGWYARRRWLR